jgi:3-oxoacyl-[acyl-carrier-protein] synthase-3
LATASALPDTVVTNEDIILRYGHKVAATAIRKIVGVETRRVAENGLADSDLLTLAGRRCLAQAGLAPEALSKLIATKFLGDRLLPPTAALTQRKLGTSLAFQAFDVDGGTNTFLQAMEVGNAAIASGDDYVLVVSGGIVNTLVTRDDPRQAFLYGDGAGAVLLGPAPAGGDSRIHAIYQFTDPAARDLVRGFELRKCVAFDMYETKDYRGLFSLYEGGDWKTVQPLVLSTMDRVAREVLGRAGFALSDMDLVLLTENHHRLWGAVLDHLGIAPAKSLSLISEYGNTLSAMLPLLLDRAVTSGRLVRGQRVLLLSIGEGLSCGGLVATF